MRTASSRRNVPSTFVRRNGSGSAMELSLWVSAAQCTMASHSGTSSSRSPASQMSPTTSSTLPEGSPAMFSRLPA